MLTVAGNHEFKYHKQYKFHTVESLASSLYYTYELATFIKIHCAKEDALRMRYKELIRLTHN